MTCGERGQSAIGKHDSVVLDARAQRNAPTSPARQRLIAPLPDVQSHWALRFLCMQLS